MKPADPIAVTLEAQQWNQVIAVLAEGSYRVVAPLIKTIGAQMQAAAGQMPQPPANGAASHASD